MKTRNSAVKIIVLSLITLALLSSCIMDAYGSFGTLVIRVPGGSSSGRAVSSDFSGTLSYRVSCKGRTNVTREFPPGAGNISISLEVGSYEVTITVFNAAGEEIGSTTLTNVSIDAGSVTSVDMPVQIDVSRKNIRRFELHYKDMDSIRSLYPVKPDPSFDKITVKVAIGTLTPGTPVTFTAVHTGVDIRPKNYPAYPEPYTGNYAFDFIDFVTPVTFVVTAENGSTKDYDIYVEEEIVVPNIPNYTYPGLDYIFYDRWVDVPWDDYGIDETDLNEPAGRMGFAVSYDMNYLTIPKGTLVLLFAEELAGDFNNLKNDFEVICGKAGIVQSTPTSSYYTNTYSFDDEIYRVTVVSDPALSAAYPMLIKIQPPATFGNPADDNWYGLPNSTLIEDGVWEEGSITSTGSAVWYSFPVTTGTTYYVWWNDAAAGDGDRTLDIVASAFDMVGNVIFRGVDSAWTSPQSFVSKYTGTVYLKVRQYGSGTGTYGIVYSTASDRPAVLWNPPSTSAALSEGVWEDGSITGSASEVWYSFPITAENTYYIWWNDSASGNYTKNLDVIVSGYFTDEESIYDTVFVGADSAWVSTAVKTYTAETDGRFYLRVKAKNRGYTGSFGIVYDTVNSRPHVPLDISGDIALDDGIWKGGSITASSNGAVWYSFDVTEGITYYLWWNDNYQGNYSKTLRIYVDAYDDDGEILFYNEQAKFNSSKSFVATVTGKVYVRVKPYIGGSTGTFGIVYSAGSDRPDPPWDAPLSIELTENLWENGYITASSGELWYAVPVESGNVYYVWWNKSGSSYGNGTKTLDITVRAHYEGTGLIVSGFDNVYSAWSAPHSFTSTITGYVYLRVGPYNAGSTGTFAIVWSTTNSKPDISWDTPSVYTPLTEDQWQDGSITSSSGGEAWHSITVEKDTTYYLWWNKSRNSSGYDYDYGNGAKTLDIRVNAYYPTSQIAITNLDEASTAWTSPQSFTAAMSGTVFIKVTPNGSSYGTYGIVYSTDSARPLAAWNPPTSAALTENQWMNGSLTSTDSEAWYSFPVTAETPYYVWVNNRNGGGSKTSDARISAFYDDDYNGIFINASYSSAQTFTARTSGTVYIKVRAYQYTGTFGVVWSTGSARPPIPWDLPDEFTRLSEGEWADGQIDIAGSSVWYSFEVESGTRYNLWSNRTRTGYNQDYGNGTKTGEINVTARYTHDTGAISMSGQSITSAWTGPAYFTASVTGTVYLEVNGYYTYSTGSFAVAYTVAPNNTRPPIPWTPPVSATALSDGTWADGEIGSAGEAWYKFNVTGDTPYYVWWNRYGSDTFAGPNGAKTSSIVVSAYYHDEYSGILYDADTAWTSPRTITARTGGGTIYLRVKSGAGTFGIVYSTSNERRPPVPWGISLPAGAADLTTAWTDNGNIASAGGELWYKFTVTKDSQYWIWWNDRYQGTGVKTLYANVSAFYSDDSAAIFSAYNGFDTPQSFTAKTSGTVYVRVKSNNSGAGAGVTGTFGIVYNTGSTRPTVPWEIASHTTLAEPNLWVDGSIGSTGEYVWYSFTAEADETYYVWWNESGGSSYGNGDKTLDISVSGYGSTGTVLFGNTASAWTTGRTITMGATGGLVYLRVQANYETGTGSYAISYSDINRRPPIPWVPDFDKTTVPLGEGVWKEGDIETQGVEHWYEFTVTAGTRYYIWWNDRNDGNGDMTLYSTVSAYYFDDSVAIFSTYSGFNSPQFFTAATSGKVYVKVAPSYFGYTGTYGIVWSTTSTRPGISWSPSGTPTPLNAGEWADGVITGSGDEIWYEFDITQGNSYYIWWNDSYYGNDTKTTRVSVSGYYDDDKAVVFTYNSGQWSSSRAITSARTSGKFYLKVTPYNYTTGTFGIVFNTANTRPPVTWTPPGSAVALAAGTWADSQTNSSNDELWYKFDVTGGLVYSVWWNDSNSGNYTKTGRVTVSAYYDDEQSGIFTAYTVGYNSPLSFTAKDNGTVYVRVRSYNSTIGTFGIVYDTVNIRPKITWPSALPTAAALDAGIWADGNIASEDGELWYKFDVTEGTRYNVWWNDNYNGNGTKTTRVSVSAFYSDDYGGIFINSTANAFSSPQYFTARTGGGTVYIRVKGYYTSNTGSFAVAYTAAPNNNRPLIPWDLPPATTLTAGTWANGEITGPGGEVWYKFDVTAGLYYSIWTNSSNGNGVKTLDINVSAFFDNDNVAIFTSTDAWYYGTGFTANSDTVYVRVRGYNSSSTGTFGLVYSAGSTRPPITWTPPSATTLSAGVWTDGTISSSVSEAWYKFDVTQGTTYYVWWNDSYDGNGMKTLHVSVDAYYHDDQSGIFTYQDWSGFSSYRSIPAKTGGGTVYLRVRSSNSGDTGTFGIAYNTANTRPNAPITATATALSAGAWKDDSITTAGAYAWYKFDVTNGNTYYVWLNGSSYGNGSKTLNANISGYYGDTGNSAFFNANSAWSTPRSFTATTTDTVYLRVNGNGTGTYGIVYNTVNTKPNASFTIPGATALTVNTWKDDSITSSVQTAWYSFNVTNGNNYYVWWNDLYDGNDTKTLDVAVSVYDGDTGTAFFTRRDNGWYSGLSFTAISTGPVYIKVEPYWSSDTGTFAVAYSTTETRP